jgi:hypothetical protein
LRIKERVPAIRLNRWSAGSLDPLRNPLIRALSLESDDIPRIKHLAMKNACFIIILSSV